MHGDIKERSCSKKHAWSLVVASVGRISIDVVHMRRFKSPNLGRGVKDTQRIESDILDSAVQAI